MTLLLCFEYCSLKCLQIRVIVVVLSNSYENLIYFNCWFIIYHKCDMSVFLFSYKCLRSGTP